MLRLLTLALAVGSGSALAQSQVASDVHPGAPIQPRNADTAPAPAAASSTARQASKAALQVPDSDQFRPAGPITITADHAELIKGDYAVYTGNVKVDSNTLKMDGARLEFKQAKNGQYVAKVTGDPAHLSHAGAGPDDPPITAHAQTIIYDSASETVKLDGKAQLTRGGNIVNGEDISYDLDKHQVQAGGGSGGQVKMVIQPPPPTPGNKPSGKPKPAGAGR